MITADKSDQNQRQHVGELSGHRGPFDMQQVGRKQGRPQAPIRRARQ